MHARQLFVNCLSTILCCRLPRQLIRLEMNVKFEKHAVETEFASFFFCLTLWQASAVFGCITLFTLN